MSQILEALHQLQVIETQLAAIRRKGESKTRHIDGYKRKISNLADRIEHNHNAARDRQIRLDALNLDVMAREESLTKQREALGKAKTNKVYAEILSILNTGKADNAKIESAILQLMEEVQTLQAEVEKLEGEKTELQARVGSAEDLFDEFNQEHSDERQRLETSRDACAEEIPPSALGLFSRAADHHDGEAMAPVAKLHPKRDDYVCTGCNMKLTLEVINSLQTRDDIQLCSSCGRVLYCETAPAT